MSPNQNRMAVESLDLSNIVTRLQAKEKFEEPRAQAAVEMYRQFLAMVQGHPEQIMVPNEDVDAAWHHHILDTQAYARDCEGMFGQFLHHNPNFYGTDAFFEACKETQKIYAETHGDGIFIESTGTTRESPAMCGGMLKDETAVNLKAAVCNGEFKRAAMCGGMLKDDTSADLKPAMCGGMLKDDSGVDLQSAMCGGMMKEEQTLNLKSSMCGGMLKEDKESSLKAAVCSGEFKRAAMCGGMLKDDTGVELKPAMCGGMLKEEVALGL